MKTEHIEFLGYEQIDGHTVAKFSMPQLKDFYLNKTGCEERLHNLCSQEFEHEKTEAILANWPSMEGHKQ